MVAFQPPWLLNVQQPTRWHPRISESVAVSFSTEVGWCRFGLKWLNPTKPAKRSRPFWSESHVQQLTEVLECRKVASWHLARGLWPPNYYWHWLNDSLMMSNWLYKPSIKNSMIKCMYGCFWSVLICISIINQHEPPLSLSSFLDCFHSLLATKDKWSIMILTVADVLFPFLKGENVQLCNGASRCAGTTTSELPICSTEAVARSKLWTSSCRAN